MVQTPENICGRGGGEGGGAGTGCRNNRSPQPSVTGTVAFEVPDRLCTSRGEDTAGGRKASHHFLYLG